MCTMDLRTAETLMALNQRETERQTARQQLARSAQDAKTQQGPAQAVRMVRQIGRTLSALGQRLEHAGLPQTSPH
jgi:hypothetical protein